MNPWYKDGLSYKCDITVKVRGQYRGTVNITLGFITYHLIRLIHGERELIAMADRSCMEWNKRREDWENL